MVQTLITIGLPPESQRILFEKPISLRRIFFGISMIVGEDVACRLNISFGDPMFYSYYALEGRYRHFELKGEGLFQGDIWARNVSTMDIKYTAVQTLI